MVMQLEFKFGILLVRQDTIPLLQITTVTLMVYYLCLISQIINPSKWLAFGSKKSMKRLMFLKSIFFLLEIKLIFKRIERYRNQLLKRQQNKQEQFTFRQALKLSKTPKLHLISLQLKFSKERKNYRLLSKALHYSKRQ